MSDNKVDDFRPASEQHRKMSPAEAREQTGEYFGFAASVFIVAGDREFEIPSPGLMDDDQQERYESLIGSLEDCKHEDVFVTNPITNELVINPEDGKPVTKSVIVEPHRDAKGKLLPPYNVRLAKAILGDADYEAFKAGGGRSSQIAWEWTRMQKDMQKRQAADSKSVDSTSGDSLVSQGD